MNDFNSALGLVKKSRKNFLLLTAVDAGFIVSFLYVFWTIVYGKLFGILMDISNAINYVPDINAELEAQARAIQEISTSTNFLSLYSSLLYWLMVLIAAVFLIIIVFNGAAFFLTSRIAGSKTGPSYFLKFTAIAAIFYSLVIFGFWMTVNLSMLSSRLAVPLFGQATINILLVIFLLFVKYLWYVSIVAIAKKKLLESIKSAFKLCFRNPVKVLKIYGESAIVVMAAIGIAYLLYMINIMLLYLGVLLLVLPAISYSRVIFFSAIDKLK